MAFDVGADSLWSEVKQAEDERDQFLGIDYEDRLARYAGPGYRTHSKNVEVDFENHSYEWISLFLPLLVSGNPKVRSRSPRRGPAQWLSKATQYAVNRNFALTNVKGTLEKMGVDYAFKWCVAITSPQPVYSTVNRDAIPYRPITKRLSPTRYLWDIVADEWTDCRFQGHLLYRDKEDLLNLAEERPWEEWNEELIQALPEDSQKRHGRKKDLVINRGEVEIYEILVHEHTLDEAVDSKGKKFKPRPEDGYHGTIFTIARAQVESPTSKKMDYVRAPRPFWGPREGPYTFGGYLTVPDEVAPLSPITATEAQAEELNNMRLSISANMESKKTGIAINSMAGEDYGEKIKEFQDLSVFPLDGVEDIGKMIAQVKLGGVDNTDLTQYQLLRDSLDRAAGMTEAQRGQATGEATATEASIAQQSSGQRMGYMTERFIQGVVKPIAEKEAFYLAFHPQSSILLGEEARGIFTDPETGEPIEAVEFVGSKTNADMFEEMDLQIEPVSMRYTSEALEAERQAKVDALVTQIAPLIPQLPWVDWNAYLTRLGEQIADPTLPHIVDVEKANLYGAMMLGAQLGGAQPQQPQPRLGKDVSPNFKASETSSGFTGNARPQPRKGPRQAGESGETHQTVSKVNAA
jgi:hypothetical protein